MQESGWLNINKPINFTSTKVVSIIKKITKAKKVGHGGTLDPMASGVLPICINKATKQVEKIMDHNKKYLFHLTFGELRDTFDKEGKIIDKNDFIPKESEIVKKISDFIGYIEQKPPIYSAIKINGKRACDLVREGKNVNLKPRIIKVDKIEYNGFINSNTIELLTYCGRGCYIRSLGIDIARSLNSIAYLTKIERQIVGRFNINDSINILDIDINKIIKNIINFDDI